MARARVHRVSLAGTTATTKARVHRVSLDGDPIVGPRARVHRVALGGPSAMTLQAFDPVTDVEPLSTVTLTAVPAPGSATPSSYLWRRVSGADMTVRGTGPSITVKAPAGKDGAATVLGVRGVIGSAQSPEQTVTVTARPQLHWIATAAGWTPVKAPVLLGGTPPPPPPPENPELATESDTE